MAKLQLRQRLRERLLRILTHAAKMCASTDIFARPAMEQARGRARGSGSDEDCEAAAAHIITRKKISSQVRLPAFINQTAFL